MSFNASMWYVKLLCDLSCRTTPVIFYYCFYFVVVNFSWASRAWCILEVKISGTKTRKPILALAFCYLASVFWDDHGILFINHLEKGRTINSEYYIALLVRLREEIAKKRPQMKKEKVLFHQVNVVCHKSIATMVKLHFELLSHLPYSPHECITLEGDYVDERSRILPRSCRFISHPTNLLSDVLYIQLQYVWIFRAQN